MRIVGLGPAELIVREDRTDVADGPSQLGVGPHGRFCMRPRRPLSPMITYSLPSGPNRITPPL